MPIFRRPIALPSGASPRQRTWEESTEREARIDIGSAFSQTPAGLITDLEIGKLLAGKEVSGRLFRWSTHIPEVPVA